MKRASPWVQRLFILGFLLFVWFVDPFSRFTPAFPVAWSLVVLLVAVAFPSTGNRALKPILIGALLGLVAGSADWRSFDLPLVFGLCWALAPLFFLPRSPSADSDR